MRSKNKEPDSQLPDMNKVEPPDVYITPKNRMLTGKRLKTFNLFWEAFDYPKGSAEAADAWLDIPRLTDSLVRQIVEAAEREAAARPLVIERGREPKWAPNWLAARRWEDDEDPQGAEGHMPIPTLDQLLASKGLSNDGT